MTWLRGLLLAVAALCCAGQAAAHATLVTASPADGSSLASAPAEIVLRFDEPVAPQSMRLVDGRGAAVAMPSAGQADGVQVRIPLPALRDGAYVFSYRVASADMHPVAGSIAFGIGAGNSTASGPHGVGSSTVPAGAGARDAADASPGPSAELLTARFVRDLLLLVASGGALFAAGVAAFARQRAVLPLAAMGAALAALFELGLQGAALLGPGTSWLAGLLAAATTRAGASAVGIVGGMLLVVAGASMRHAARARALLLPGGLAAAASLCLTGHAASAHPGWLAQPLVACHALVAAFWIGSLVALWQMLRTQDAAAAAALHRFSAIALPAVALLAAAGVAFAFLQLRTPDAWMQSGYGGWVLVKMALLSALLALAACNRFVLLPRLARGRAHALPWLRRSVAGELVLVVLVVAATSVLSRTPPHAAPAAVTTALAGTAGFSGSVTLSGRGAFSVLLRDPQGRLLDPIEVELRIGNRQAGIEPLLRTPVRTGPGRFIHEGAGFAFPGTWQFTVEGRIGDFDRFTLRAEIAVQ